MLRPERIEEYVERHRDVWPEMQTALRDSGWRNYSLFLAPGGLLVGYLEAADFDEARQKMKALNVNERWQAEMVTFFESSGENADDSMRPLQEIFHLD
jgi:L-rhamnose mutarotase